MENISKTASDAADHGTSEDQLAEQFRVLHDMCHAYGSSPTIGEVFASLRRWVGAALGPGLLGLRVVLPDNAGRLQEVFWEGQDDRSKNFRARARRKAFRDRALAVQADDDGATKWAYLPMVTRGQAVGVIEIRGTAEALSGVPIATLEAIVSQTAITLQNILRRKAGVDGPPIMDMTELVQQLLAAPAPRHAVDATTAFLHEHLDAPTACWLGAPADLDLQILSVRGLSPADVMVLRSELPALSRWSYLGREERARVIRRFAEIAGSPGASVLDAGNALIVVGGANREDMLETVTTLLQDSLDNLTAVTTARLRNESLDLGLACTAHEFRGSLAAVKHVLEILQRGWTGTEVHRELLEHSEKELERLSVICSSLLHWSLTPETLEKETTDLTDIVREAVTSWRLESGDDRVTFEIGDGLEVAIDQYHVRGALTNVLRNATNQTPDHRRVEVVVHGTDDVATIEVRDGGPPLKDAAERFAMFDPFTGLAASTSPRAGRSLDLYIARQIIEAHGGSILLSNRTDGMTFHIQLPVSRTEEPSARSDRR
ncbi:MAG: sensor histidine kinase [Actinomycetota bacterium]